MSLTIPLLLAQVALLLAQVALLLALTWGYFARYQLERAPIGVMNTGDIIVIMFCILLLPNLYILLPTWALLCLLLGGGAQLLLLVLAPIVPARPLRWGLVLGLLALDCWVTYALALPSLLRLLVGNSIVVLLTLCVAVLWVQSGMRARHVALLAAFLIGYDYLATVRSPLMDAMFARMLALPLAPALLVPTESGGWMGLGMGDLLLAALSPIALWKAFGRRAGMLANLLTLLALTALPILLLALRVRATFPVMLVLGPLLLLQYAAWRRRGPERTMRDYWPWACA